MAEHAQAQEAPDPDLCVEAALLASGKPVAGAKLAEAAGLKGTAAVRQAVWRLNEAYEQTGRSFTIEEVAGGFQVLTRAAYESVVATVQRSRAQSRLSPSAMETLAVIAYRQPIGRAEVETIRGVASGEIIRGLMERRLVKVVGRAQELGRPMLYGTTRTFLEVFGLSSLKDLPPVERAPDAGGSEAAALSSASEGAEAASARHETEESPNAEGPAREPDHAQGEPAEEERA